MLRTFLFLLGIATAPISLAQFLFEYDASPRVLRNGDTLGLAWSGGFNNPQFSEIDVDFDGDSDLFVFDRSSDQVIVFEHKTDGAEPYYQFLEGAALVFPPDLKYRARCVDYDQDGRNDLFTYGTGGLAVYRNVGNATDGLQWELVESSVQSDYWGFVNTLYISSADIPAITDVDADGDIDILTFHVGGEYLQYHKNQSMEWYGVPDSLAFELRNECWGGFREDVNTSFIYLNWPDSPCATGNVPGAELEEGHHQQSTNHENAKALHAGSTVLALDVDDSGVLDLLLGDIAYPNLHLLVNGGGSPNTNSMMVSTDNAFPSNSLPVSMSLFPAPFLVDVDFDGVRDLLVAPNAKGVSQDENSVAFYRNTGTNAVPVFGYQQDDFLQGRMIDHGTASRPVLADVDNDGLPDLFVGIFHRFESVGSTRSTIAYYRNTGTAQEPEFTLIDADFLNLSSEALGLHVIPTFGDLDNDGDKDLILGLENGTVAYLENTSSFPSISFSAPVYNYADHTALPIDVGQFAAPQLIDLSEDGLLDLVIGCKTGELFYYENTGTNEQPSFELLNAQLGMIDLAPVNSDGYAIPHFTEWHDSMYLFLGGSDGALRIYGSISGHLGVGETFVQHPTDYLNIHSGAYSAFCTADIDGDDRLNVMAGNELGGVRHYEHNPDSDLGFQTVTNLPHVHIYPNPAVSQLHIATGKQERHYYCILDLSGRRIKDGVFDGAGHVLDLSHLSAGQYLLYVQNAAGNAVRKFIRQESP